MSPLFDFSGRTVLVTGGGTGLGRAMALGFAAHGANILLASRDKAACDKVASEVAQLGRTGRAFEFDATDWDFAERLTEEAWRASDGIDILVNNAGRAQKSARSAEVDDQEFDDLIAVNLRAPFRLGTLIGERMASRGGGAIINIGSFGSIHPAPPYAVYAAAKAGLDAITIAHAREFAPHVRVNAILPGAFETEMAKDWAPEQKERPRSWLQRNGQPQDIVTTALYLASPATAYTTGTLIRVDGGRPA